MYRKVLLCYDGSAEGRRALRQGADVIMCMKSEAYLLAVCRNAMGATVPEGVTPMLAQSEHDIARGLLDEGVQWLKDRDIVAQGSLAFGDAIHHISSTARDIGADLIVVGYKHRGPLARWWTESEEETLLERVNCSLLVCLAEGEEA